MPRLARFVAVSIMAALAACAGGNGPPYPEVAASAAPIAAGRSRLVLYRTLYTEIQTLHPGITIDGVAAGVLPEGTFLWLEEPAGLHVVDSPPVARIEAFGAQLPTVPLSVELAPGGTTYIAVDVEAGTGQVIVSLRAVDPGRAMADLRTLEQAPPARASQ